MSVIIPSNRGSETLKRLTDSIPDECEVIVVMDKVSLARKRNLGAANASGKYLLFIDDDNRIMTGAIDGLLECFIDDNSVGIVGMVGRYINQKEIVWDGGSKRNLISGFTSGENLNRHYKFIDRTPYEVDEVANAFMVRADLFWGFDEKHFPIDLDEADLCRRMKLKGYKVMVAPLACTFHSTITHSRIPDFRRPKNAYFMGRNRIIFQRFYCPHLWIYFLAFLPVFVVSYSLCLVCRGKFGMVYHFLRGIRDGLFNKTDCPERYNDWR